MDQRVITGINWLDELLYGGLIPGTMTLVLGATGIGKTHLGLSFANQSFDENRHSIILDMTSRGDSQNHSDYAKRLFDRGLTEYSPIELDQIWDKQYMAHYYQLFEELGQKVIRSQMSDDQWHRWQIKIQGQLQTIATYFYYHFIHGTNRVVVDGIEPVVDINESAQHEIYDYIYHKIIKPESGWLAREVFREKFLKNENLVNQFNYNEKEITTVFLQTTEESLLKDLIEKKNIAGGLEAIANTIILMGKKMLDDKIVRQLYIAKHRGSKADDKIITFDIDEDGLILK